MSSHLQAIKQEIKDTLAVSLPLVSSQLVYASSSFLGTVMVSRLGEDALAASVLVNMIWMSFFLLFIGMLNAVSILVSHQFGANNYDSISKIMGQAYKLGAIVMVLLTGCMLIVPHLSYFTSQPPNVLALAKIYVHTYLFQIPALVLLVITEQFLAGINRTKMVLRISLVVVPIEIVLIYSLIFGKFGLPQCGIAGVGYAFAITYTCTIIFMLWYLQRTKQYQVFGIFTHLTSWHLNYFRELIRVGIPMGFMHVIELTAFTVMTFWVSRFGTTMLAAHQIVLQYLSFVITLVFAMSQAVTVRVGFSVGREDETAARYASFVGMFLNFVIILTVALLFIFLPHIFLSLDINLTDPANTALIRDASTLLMVVGLLLIFDNFRIIGFGALRGLKDTNFPMYASLFSFWVVGLSAAYYLGFVLQLDGAGVWLGMTFGIAVCAGIVFRRLRKILRTMDVVKIKNITA